MMAVLELKVSLQAKVWAGESLIHFVPSQVALPQTVPISLWPPPAAFLQADRELHSGATGAALSSARRPPTSVALRARARGREQGGGGGS